MDLEVLSPETFKHVYWAPGYYDGDLTKAGDRYVVTYHDWIGFRQTWEITSISEDEIGYNVVKTSLNKDRSYTGVQGVFTVRPKPYTTFSYLDWNVDYNDANWTLSDKEKTRFVNWEKERMEAFCKDVANYVYDYDQIL